MLSMTSDAAGLERVSKFQSAPHTVTVVAALQSIAAKGRFQMALSGCPNTRNTKCSAETAKIPLAVAFIAVAMLIGDKFCADGLDCSQPTEPEQECRRIGVLRLSVQPGQLKD